MKKLLLLLFFIPVSMFAKEPISIGFKATSIQLGGDSNIEDYSSQYSSVGQSIVMLDLHVPATRQTTVITEFGIVSNKSARQGTRTIFGESSEMSGYVFSIGARYYLK